MKTALCASLLAILVCQTDALAQWHGSVAPDSLSFQGYLTDDVGDPVTGFPNLTFKLYKNGTQVWSQTKNSVAVADGLFDVVLGGVGAASLDTVAFDQPIELGITVGTDPEISPRTTLAASAYALGIRGLHAVAASDGSSHAPNLIGGASNNFVAAGVVGATIGGGGGTWNSTPGPDSVTANWGTVGGGLNNRAKGIFSTVGGGEENRATDGYAAVAGGQNNEASGFRSSVGGGEQNSASGFGATVGGGTMNQATGERSVVGGGDSNTAGADWATVSGGSSNSATGQRSAVGGGNTNAASDFAATVGGGSANSASGDRSTVGGGGSNSATSIYSTVAGGTSNTAGADWATVGGGSGNVAAGSRSFVGGGWENVAKGLQAAVPGGYANQARGSHSFAAGYKARAIHEGSFVWNDRSKTTDNDSLVSTAANQFLVRAAGGFGIGTASPKQGLTISRDVEAAAYQLELRNVGDIHGGYFSGIAFTQTSTGATENASIKVIYHSDGKPDMSFSVRDAADALFIKSVTGDIGVGTTSPTVALEVNGEIKAPTITETSDARMKRNVAPIHNALELVTGLQGVSFDWNREAWPHRVFEAGRQIGLIAQEVERVVPEVVHQDNDGYYSVAYSKLVPLLIEAIKEQQELIEAQNRNMTAQDARIAELERRMMP